MYMEPSPKRKPRAISWYRHIIASPRWRRTRHSFQRSLLSPQLAPHCYPLPTRTLPNHPAAVEVGPLHHRASSLHPPPRPLATHSPSHPVALWTPPGPGRGRARAASSMAEEADDATPGSRNHRYNKCHSVPLPRTGAHSRRPIRAAATAPASDHPAVADTRSHRRREGMRRQCRPRSVTAAAMGVRRAAGAGRVRPLLRGDSPGLGNSTSRPFAPPFSLPPLASRSPPQPQTCTLRSASWLQQQLGGHRHGRSS